MRKVKIIISSILIVLMLLGGGYLVLFFGRARESKRIVTTIFPIYDIVTNIMGSDDDVMILEQNGTDMHSYDPTIMDMLAIYKSDLFIYIGGESEEWADDFAKDNETRSLKLIDTITKLEESEQNVLEEGEHEHEEHDHDEEEIEYDEHIWLSLKNMVKMTTAVCNKLKETYPERAVEFDTNASEYISKLQELDNEYETKLSTIEKTFVFADRFPFLYLAHDYGINYVAAFSGCSAESEASFGTIMQLVDVVDSEELKCIFVLENSSLGIAPSVRETCNNHNLKIFVIDSCQSINTSLKNGARNKSYIEVMTKNLNNLLNIVNLEEEENHESA